MTKILLVEDDKSLREIYGVRLLAEGYDIVSAGDGEEALAMAIKERPNLIISDVMMPKISGFDMLDILRSTTETRTIRVIMMTALSSEEQRQRGEALGADRYLVKSQVGIEDVVRVVHEVLDDQPTVSGAGAGFSGADYATPSIPTTPIAAPQYQPAMPQPVVPEVTYAPQPVVSPAPVPVPVQTAAPEPPVVAAMPIQPLPTPNYDTPRPASAGERIIQPLPSSLNPSTPPDMGALLDRELAAANAAPQQSFAMPTPPSMPSGPVTGPLPTPTYEYVQPQVPTAPPQPQSGFPAPANAPVQPLDQAQ